MSTVEEQLDIIRRGVHEITPLDGLRTKLERSVKTGKPLRIKYGIDPTGFDVHLGHTVPLRKLRQFQSLGHQAVLIIGDYTAMVGDPSGRDQSRKGLTPEQIESNARGYLTQIAKIIDIDKAEVRRNGEWFGKFNFADVLKLTGQITIQRMIERDDFTKRVKSGAPIYLSETLYPLMQGRDSVEIQSDVELGGTEQHYNLMVGRDLQTDAGQEPQICITMPILKGLDGQAKMGKSAGNYIGVAESAKEQFGKTMSIADGLMREWYELLTDRPQEELSRLLAGHPMDAKKTLGRDIVSFYYGAEEAARAQADWEKQFSNKQDPDEIPSKSIDVSSLTEGGLTLAKLLVALQLASSGNEARRKIQEGAVSVGPTRDKLSDPNAVIKVTEGLVVRVGRKIVAVKLQ